MAPTARTISPPKVPYAGIKPKRFRLAVIRTVTGRKGQLRVVRNLYVIPRPTRP